MKQRLNIEMALRVWLIIVVLLTAAQLASADTAPPLYTQVAGGEKEIAIEKPTSVDRLALEQGVRWVTVARENGLKKPYKLKPGMVLKINNTHIVPTEVQNGLVINLPEMHLYYFQNGAYQRRYALAVGKPSWPTPPGPIRSAKSARTPPGTCRRLSRRRWKKGVGK